VVGYAARRVVIGVGTLLAVSILIFVTVQALPGDAASVAVGRGAPPDLLKLYRHELGLDLPIWAQYLRWVNGLLHGSLGTSYLSHLPVVQVLSDRLRNSFMLTLETLAVLVPLSVGLGIYTAVRRNSRLDRFLTVGLLGFVASPEFVIGALLIYLFATTLKLLPAVSLVDPSEPVLAQTQLFALPMLTLVAASLAHLTRLIRATMFSVLEAEYINTAILKGVPMWRVYLLHAFPNAVGPILQLVAMSFGWLLAGQVVVEALFQFPGLGSALASAINFRDLPIVEGVSLLVTATFVLANVAADLLAAFLNPRVRMGAS
jgi:peptide/nickel transport system permease protein